MVHLYMDIYNIQVLYLLLLIAENTYVQPLVFHPVNQKGQESLRMIRSEEASRSLVRNRTLSIYNCYGSICTSNEEFCDESKEGCSTCQYENDICTQDLDCFNFCSEKATRELCIAWEGPKETLTIPWWQFILAILFVVSVSSNVYFILKLISWKCKRDKPERRGDSEIRVIDIKENSSVLSTERAVTQSNPENKGEDSN